MYSHKSAGLNWRKSSRSTAQGTNCVEVARGLEAVAVRDSKDPDGPMLTFSARAFSAFLASTKRGEVGD